MQDDHTYAAGLLYKLWGKTNELNPRGDKQPWCWHPAICHMLDVAYVAETWLKAHPMLLDKLAQESGYTNREALLPVLLTLTALHDLGKLHPCFQEKSPRGWKKGYAQVGLESELYPGTGFDHGAETARMLFAWSIHEDENWQPYIPAVRATAAHHGRFHVRKETKIRKIPSWYSCLPCQTAVREAVTVCSDVFGFSPKPPPDETDLSAQGFLMLFAGFVSVVDWIGSAISTEQMRPDGPGSKVTDADSTAQYLEDLRTSNQAENMLRGFGLLPKFNPNAYSYTALFPFISTDADLRPLQREAKKLPFGKTPGPELVIIEAPMGMGKTEIALYLTAQALCPTNDTATRTADGLYYALPTQASTNYMFSRLCVFAKRMSVPGHPIALALAHGARNLFEPYDKLRQKGKRFQKATLSLQRAGSNAPETGEEDTPGEVLATSWLQSAKRALLAPIGLGTVDQAMLGALRVRHAFVRLYGLGQRVVVLDEIHAYDVYMNTVLFRLLAWLRAMNCKVILLSATLPRSLRAKLFEAYGSAEPASGTSPELDPYPQLLHTRKGEVERYILPKDEQPAPKVIHIECHEIAAGTRTEVGAQKVLEAARSGGCVAWIRNTVKEAQAAWRVLYKQAQTENIPIVLLHARFTRADRNRIEKYIEDCLGPPIAHTGRNHTDKDIEDCLGASKPAQKSVRPPRLIVVATQVIEQSVDLDFDVMFSDLAPIDLLLQRAGRLHRHKRPAEARQGHTTATLHVLLPTVEERQQLDFGSSKFIYDPETLARTAALLSEDTTDDTLTWLLPDACRTLVARLYDLPETWTAQRLGVPEPLLAAARRRQRQQQIVMERTASWGLMPAPGKRLEMKDARQDRNEDTVVHLSTRYQNVETVTLVLFRLVNGVPHLLAAPPLSLTAFPSADDVEATLFLDRAIAASSVSFPWHQHVEQSEPPEALRPLVRWWRRRHRFDDRVFLILGDDGMLNHDAFIGRYTMDHEGHAMEGLVLARHGQSPPDAIPLEDL